MSLEKNLCSSGREESLRDSRADGLAAAAQPTPITELTNYTDMLSPLYLQHMTGKKAQEKGMMWEELSFHM